jgi:hyperosmotically inducible periplasmic protein
MHLSKWSAALVAGLFRATAGQGMAADDKSKSTTEKVKTDVSDSWLTAKTKIALYGDDRVSGTQINVDTKNGVVSLRGTVDSDAAKAAAGEIAKGVDGVKSVRNNLQVVAASSKKAVEAKDDDITKGVKNRLAKDGRLKSVDVRTDAGVVTLQGKVTSVTDSARASEMARQVPGVRSVKNELTSGS